MLKPLKTRKNNILYIWHSILSFTASSIRKSYLSCKNINAQDERGYTMLHLACFYGKTEEVKYLLQIRNINTNLRNNYGNTALHFAIMIQNQEIIEELLKEKAIDINIENNYGNTPIRLAIEMEAIPISKALIQKGAELTIDHLLLSTKWSLNELQSNIFTENQNKFRDFYQHTVKKNAYLFYSIKNDLVREYRYQLTFDRPRIELLANHNPENRPRSLTLLLCIQHMSKEIKQKISNRLIYWHLLGYCMETSQEFKEQYILKYECPKVIEHLLNQYLDRHLKILHNTQGN